MKSLLLLLLSCLVAAAQLQIRTYLNSSYLLPGESTQLVIETKGEISARFQTPDSDSYKLTYKNSTPYTTPERTRGYRYYFKLTSLHQGTHRIPALEIEVEGRVVRTAPLTFYVISAQELTFQKIQIGSRELSCATHIFLPKGPLYVGETVPTEVKLYLPFLPRHYSIIETGLPEIKRDGITAWRYMSPKDVDSFRPFLLPNGPYISLSYRSTAHALHPGEITLGGGNARPVFQAVSSVNGQPQWQDLPVYLPLTPITRTALPLPDGAPLVQVSPDP